MTDTGKPIYPESEHRQVIGQALHEMYCTANHIDRCSFYTDSRWGALDREKWYKNADLLQSVISLRGER